MTATEAPGGGPLNQDELRDLMSLLARYRCYDLDQWENWRLQLPHGPVYVSFANKLLPGAPDEAYHTVCPLPRR